MPRVDYHVMGFHCILDFVDDCASGGLYAQHLGNLYNMIRGSVFSNHSYETSINTFGFCRLFRRLAFSNHTLL